MGQDELADGYLIYWFKSGIYLNFLHGIHTKSAKNTSAVVNRRPDVLLVVWPLEVERLHVYRYGYPVARDGAELAPGALVLDEQVPSLEPRRADTGLRVELVPGPL
jgi:hypothetical protein